MKKIKEFLNKTPLRIIWTKMKDTQEMNHWKKNPKTPPPHAIKEQAILELAKKFGTNVLVETGTYKGDMVNAMKKYFKEIYSIELDKTLASQAQRRFLDISSIHILHGDSAQVLPKVLTSVNEPALFWLDGHFSGGATAKGDLDTPIMAELKFILSAGLPSFVIVIDDARLFVGKNDYPSMEALRSLVASYHLKLNMEIFHDAIRITPVEV